MFLTIVSVVATAFFTLLLLAIYIKKTLPNILTEVAVGAGQSISTQLNETLAQPNVKRAFSILGKESGEVRADNALREKAADAFVGQSPVIKMALDKFGLSALDGLKLFNDPLFGPIIKGAIESFTQPSKDGGTPSSSSRQDQKAVGRM